MGVCANVTSVWRIALDILITSVLSGFDQGFLKELNLVICIALFVFTMKTLGDAFLLHNGYKTKDGFDESEVEKSGKKPVFIQRTFSKREIK